MVNTRVKCRKITIEEYVWDMFDETKWDAEKEFGLMGNGMFLKMLLLNYLQLKQTEDEQRRRFKTKNSEMGKQKKEGKSIT